MLYLNNAFSAGMFEQDCGGDLTFMPLSVQRVQRVLAEREFVSTIGHEDTARLLTALLDVDVQFQRGAGVTFVPGDEMIIAQYNGPRLPEGATSLPEGARMRFFLVKWTLNAGDYTMSRHRLMPNGMVVLESNNI